MILRKGENRGYQDTFIIADPGFFLLTALIVRATSTNGFFSGFPSWQISTIVVSSIRKNLQIPYRVYVQSSLVTDTDEGKDRSRMTGSQNSRSISSRVSASSPGFPDLDKNEIPIPYDHEVATVLPVLHKAHHCPPCSGDATCIIQSLPGRPSPRHLPPPEPLSRSRSSWRLSGLSSGGRTFLFCILSSFWSDSIVVVNQRFPGY